MSRWFGILMLLIFAVNSAQANEELLRQQEAAFLREDFHPWVWGESQCQRCSIYILPTHNDLDSEEVMAFLTTIAVEKKELLELYGIDGQEYNLLAHMAVGILGRESAFFGSRRYWVKEAFPGVVRGLKKTKAFLQGLDGPSRSSRGPTQIKVVPEKIAAHYGVVSENLYVPENAAVATMGFLIETLAELKRRVVANDLDYIDKTNYDDYLPYLYFGARKALINKTATPDQNIYIKDMRKYMSWVRIFEGPAL